MTDPLESHLLAQTSGRQVLFWHEVRALSVTSRLPSQDATVVDIGAGAGTLGDILQRDHPAVRYRFYEPIDSMADLLEERYGADARLADATSIEADIVTLLDVIEHVAEPKAMLAPVVEAARPGTLFVITVPALNALWSSWDEELGHYRRYTKRMLTDEVRSLPLDVIETAYLFPELVPPALVRRVLRRRRNASAGGSEFPELPHWLDRVLLSFCRLTYRARLVWPAGTSLVLVARRR